MLTELPAESRLADPCHHVFAEQFGASTGLEPHQKVAIDALVGHFEAIV